MSPSGQGGQSSALGATQPIWFLPAQKRWQGRPRDQCDQRTGNQRRASERLAEEESMQWTLSKGLRGAPKSKKLLLRVRGQSTGHGDQ